MDNNYKIQHLQTIIDRELTPIIYKKCILTDLPYHNNPGDHLIWRGELDFLRQQNIEILDQTSNWTFKFPTIDATTCICMHGGGNFGDLYHSCQDFRLKIIKHYPNNRIVMFPQSVWYSNYDKISLDADIINSHGDIYLCARDEQTYDFMKKHFFNAHILLVPDMAFYIKRDSLEKYALRHPIKGELYLKRSDKELASFCDDVLSESHDWPSFEAKNNIDAYLYRVPNIISRLNRIGILNDNVRNGIVDTYYARIMSPIFIKSACSFISQYQQVTTTRLHAMILSVLLNRQVKYIDNSTKKLSAFAETWLKDLDSVKPY